MDQSVGLESNNIPTRTKLELNFVENYLGLVIVAACHPKAFFSQKVVTKFNTI